jgi:hypothetical protein
MLRVSKYYVAYVLFVINFFPFSYSDLFIEAASDFTSSF